MIKFLIIQNRLENKSLCSVNISESGRKTTYTYNPQEVSTRKMHKIIDKHSYKINSKHQLKQLLKILTKETGIDLTLHFATLNKIKEYYDRRYCKDASSSISLSEMNKVDEIFFFLRKRVNINVPRALIDEISFQKKFKLQHPLPYFIYAYKNNRYFESRRHPVVNQLLPDGRIIENDGINDLQKFNSPL